MAKPDDEAEDAILLALARQRDSEGAETYSFPEVMEMLGLTEGDLTGWEDVEIEL